MWKAWHHCLAINWWIYNWVFILLGKGLENNNILLLLTILQCCEPPAFEANGLPISYLIHVPWNKTSLVSANSTDTVLAIIILISPFLPPAPQIDKRKYISSRKGWINIPKYSLFFSLRLTIGWLLFILVIKVSVPEKDIHTVDKHKNKRASWPGL